MNTLITIFNVATVMFGFGLIIVIHELGHFVAARWAGVRVLAFAVGFGSPIVTFRKGMGWSRRSTEQEAAARIEGGETGISATEYRLNTLPLGGYVKMLGQDDADPSHRSEAEDSYNTAPIWKRLIIISAGVVFNIITAAVMFWVVFTIGMTTEAPVVGDVTTNGPAATAVVTNANGTALDAGLRAGDTIVSIDESPMYSFNALSAEAAMTGPNQTRSIVIERDGQQLFAALTPEKLPGNTFYQFGFEAARSHTLIQEDHPVARQLLDSWGYEGVPMGSTLVSVNGTSADSLFQAESILQSSRAIEAIFEGPDGSKHSATLTPEPTMQVSQIRKSKDRLTRFPHILGFTPVMMVADIPEPDSDGKGSPGYAAGLRKGDVFARLGELEYPSFHTGLTEVSRHKGKLLRATVLRMTDQGESLVDLELPVDKSTGRVGFTAGTSEQGYSVIASTPRDAIDLTGETISLPAQKLALLPGTRIVSIGDREIESFSDLLDALQQEVNNTAPDAEGVQTIELTLRLPLATGAEPVIEVRELPIDAQSADRLLSLGWRLPSSRQAFAPVQTVMQGENAMDAIGLGIAETQRVMTSTYLTFLRLFQGTIAIEGLNGPVGIVHIGTLLADRGVIWLCFFFALVSVNLAVINFLPIPITDGGQAIFLLWEQITGKPVSILVHNIATLVGLVLIGSVFLVVTFNDIKRLLGL